ncbi:zinc-binding metallopeptidase [Sphingobacterium rhinopitheci]|uniref:zinc-binding metallopeptidase n=1 Tax=Sphingobacterium rhinopitheci TaxID=2781960 RepID=UPI001F523DC9|nr:putative zinc-binding metallopeptidase [Sphingobacterium rhinopitheci]MCI0920451.1 putative zinc-binding metallopeptidase [Sphingobacterium rhinopitheci]
MKKIIFKYTFIVFGVILFAMTSCEKKEVLDASALNLGGDNWEKSNVDIWIYDSLTKPYNIEVKYKWDRSELNMNKTLVPPRESIVIPVMTAMKQVWIKPYEFLKGPNFIKEIGQKQFILVGSVEYNSNGTIVLGQADGGRKITLFEINNFDLTNRQLIKRMLKTMHHEFAHILHQKKMFTTLYAQVTPGGYDPTWFNFRDAEVLRLGFISAYSRNSVEDDFVEMIAIMLTEGKAAFDALVNSAGAGAPALRQKELYVRQYMLETWDIDMTALQNQTQDEINAL